MFSGHTTNVQWAGRETGQSFASCAKTNGVRLHARPLQNAQWTWNAEKPRLCWESNHDPSLTEHTLRSLWWPSCSVCAHSLVLRNIIRPAQRPLAFTGHINTSVLPHLFCVFAANSDRTRWSVNSFHLKQQIDVFVRSSRRCLHSVASFVVSIVVKSLVFIKMLQHVYLLY